MKILGASQTINKLLAYTVNHGEASSEEPNTTEYELQERKIEVIVLDKKVPRSNNCPKGHAYAMEVNMGVSHYSFTSAGFQPEFPDGVITDVNKGHLIAIRRDILDETIKRGGYKGSKKKVKKRTWSERSGRVYSKKKS